MALGHTKRHLHILGDVSRADVREGNLCAERMAVLIKILEARQVFWLIEQPKGSKFFSHPDMHHVLSLVHHVSIRTYMGHWGHPMAKATLLVGRVPKEMEGLAKPKPEGIERGWGSAKQKNGKWVSATKNLGRSAAYPQGFCEEYAARFAVSTSLPTTPLPADYSIWETTGAAQVLAPKAQPGGVKDFLAKKEKARGNALITSYFKKAVLGGA